MDILIPPLIQGLCLSAMGLGIYITMKIFRIPDITTDGSYTLGAVVTALLLTRGWNPLTVIPITLGAGILAGILTGLVHTKMKIDALLAGILVMTGLFSINLTLLGRSTLPFSTETVFSYFTFFERSVYNELLVSGMFLIVLTILLAFVLRTDFGIAMRATGSSETMARALGINTERMKIIGLAIANGLTALSGYLMAQFQGFTDVNMGVGIVLIGLGSVLIGEAIITWLRLRRVFVQLILVVLGCIIFQQMVGLALMLGYPTLIKLITSALVLLIVGVPRLFKRSVL
jgi:putative ABC transport system permease protein